MAANEVAIGCTPFEQDVDVGLQQNQQAHIGLHTRWAWVRTGRDIFACKLSCGHRTLSLGLPRMPTPEVLNVFDDASTMMSSMYTSGLAANLSDMGLYNSVCSYHSCFSSQKCNPFWCESTKGLRVVPHGESHHTIHRIPTYSETTSRDLSFISFW